MQGLRHDFLSGSMLSGDQDICVGGSHPRNSFEHGLHGGGGGNEIRPALGAKQTIFRFQTGCSLQSTMQFDLGTKNREQPLVLPWFLYKISCSTPHGFNREFDV